MNETNLPANQEEHTESKEGMSAQLKDKLEPLRQFFQTKRRFSFSFKSFVKDYNFSQLCYFAAILLFAQSLWTDTFGFLLPGFIALIGLTRELLRLFEYIWSYTLGKSVVLVMYAGTANVSLAFAAMQINYITGVEPTPFVFTLGFTTIVMLPLWIAMASILFFSLALVVANLWLLIRLPLKLMGLNTAIHWEDQKHPLITMLLRIMLIPSVLALMVQFSFPFLTNTTVWASTADLMINENGGISITRLDEEKTQEALLNSGLSEDEAKEVTDKVKSQVGVDPAVESVKTTENEEEKSATVRDLIAYFLYNFEAYPNSLCIKEEDERSVIIDENSALMVRRDTDAEYGFTFTVVPCQPRY